MRKPALTAFAGALALVRPCQADEPDPQGAAVVKVTGHYDNAVGTSHAASEGPMTADLIASRPAMRTGAHGQGYSDLNFLIPELVR